MQPSPSPADTIQRKRHAGRERNEAAILRACRGLMVRGIFRPSVVDVADAAGVSVRCVFQRFGSHEALLLAALDDDGTYDTIRALAEQSGIVRSLVLGRAG